MRILIVSMSFPLPLKSGGRIRVFHLIKRLAASHQITLLCLADSRTDVDDHLPELARYCERIEAVPWRPGLLGLLWRLLRGAGRWLRGLPLVVLNKRSPELARRLSRLVREGGFDVVQIEWAQMAQHVAEADWPRLGRCGVLVEHDVAWIPLQRRADVTTGLRRRFWRWEAARMRAYESAACRRFRRVVAVSRADAARLSDLGVREVEVVPNGVDVDGYASPEPVKKDAATLLFVGWLRHGPNVDAILYLLDAIVPLITARVPHARVVVAGAPVPRVVRRAAARCGSVELAGFVADVAPLVRAATISVVPLRVGGGTRLKILESMAAGTAVVSTSIGCEGLDVVPERHLLVGDTPEAFASQAVRAVLDPTLRSRLEREARALVRDRYDWGVIATQMDDVYRALGNS